MSQGSWTTTWPDLVSVSEPHAFDTVSETYALGRATVFDVLAEQRRYLETERGYTEALSEAFASRVGLERATGGRR